MALGCLSIMYTKFVIFYTSNYCQKIKSFFDVDELISSGINVEFWNLSDITAHEKLSSVSSEHLIEIKIKTYKELKTNIKRLRNEKCLYLSFINYASYSYKVYRLLSKFKSDILYATSGVLPFEPIAESNRIANILKLMSVKNIVQTIFLRCIKKTRLFRPAKYVMMSCEHASCDYKVSNSTKYISCNSSDYNDYKRLKCYEQKKQIAFIDQYTPFHSDNILRGLSQIPAKKYYNALNLFFSRIEEKYGSEVVICAHPSALKYKEKDYFNGRKVVYNETALQIKKSIGVITHFSTAISFPIIDFKPIILITTDDMESYHLSYASFERYLSRLLSLPLINIDHSEDCEFKEIDNGLYESYLNGYLTTPQMRDKYNADVLISIAKGNYNQFIYKI